MTEITIETAARRLESLSFRLRVQCSNHDVAASSYVESSGCTMIFRVTPLVRKNA